MFDDKRIIFVHGRASKPSADDLHRLWLTALETGLREVNDGLSATEFGAVRGRCSSAYWARQLRAG